MRGALPRLVSFAVSCPEFLRTGLRIDLAGVSLQICECQRAEDLDVIFGEDRMGPTRGKCRWSLTRKTPMVPDEENASAEQATDDEETASDGEADVDSPIASDAGKRTDGHGDTTESSGDTIDADVEGDGDGGHVAASPASAASDFDRAACGGSDLERSEVAPAPSSRGKSPVLDVAEQADGGGLRVFVDLSSSSDPDSEGSSSVLASKPAVSNR